MTSTVQPKPPEVNEPRPKTDFSETQIREILAYTRGVVEATVKGNPPASALEPGLDQSPAYGIFVTLRRATLLRACRGRWGGVGNTLGPLLNQVACDTSTLDPRFASITPRELGYLNIDVSLMFDPVVVEAQGEDRIDAIEVGTHGLVIDHPRGGGLLLPHVATEAGWDAKAFLDHLALKAGLPIDTWRRDPSAKLLTFHTRLFTSEAPRHEINIHQLQSEGLNRLLAASNLMLQDQPFEELLNEAITQTHEQELGVHLQTHSGASATAVASGRSLLELVMAAVRSLKKIGIDPVNDPVKGVTLLWQPIRLNPSDYPNRHSLLGDSAIRIRRGDQWQLALPLSPDRTDQVWVALSKMQITRRQWQQCDSDGTGDLTAFVATRFESREKPGEPITRQPAQAGRFYPADPGPMNDAIDAHFAEAGLNPNQRPTQPCRSVMLPHAGWQFCGHTLAATLARVPIPKTIILIGPKHTPFGAPCSIAPHQRWKIPGASIPIATEVVKRLTELVPQLEPEPHAHRMEHGSEVLLPFLHRLEPEIRVVPIVMGDLSYDSTTALARGLAMVIQERAAADEEAPLLVISSDMNHFAPEPENRKLDQMAIDAMLSGSPSMLFDTCEDHQISMCGLLPAVTVMQALSQAKPLDLELVHYSNSAQVTGDTSRVVGYAGVVIK